MNEEVIVAFHYQGGGGNRSRCEYKPEIKCLQDIISKDITVCEDEDGNTQPDKDWVLYDTGGNELLRGRDTIESDTGYVDYDGDYDSWSVEDINDCSEREERVLYEAYKAGQIPGYIAHADEIKDYAVESQGLHRVHSINNKKQP